MLSRNLITKTFFGHSLLLVVPAAFNPNVCHASPTGKIPGSTLPFLSWYNPTKNASPDAPVTEAVATTVTLNKHVIGFVNAYVKKEDEFLQKMKGKSRSYFRTIENVFNQYGIPAQLKYLAVVESQLRLNALSRVGAKGLWQLMPVTGRELGLRISGKTDERNNAYRSTVAAAKYLRSLYADFGDWLLVLAAYNSGPGTVYKAIKRSGSKNFWALQRFLPAESRGHVKRFIGIHYFFEGEGSVATQTAAETKVAEKKMATDSASL